MRFEVAIRNLKLEPRALGAHLKSQFVTSNGGARHERSQQLPLPAARRLRRHLGTSSWQELFRPLKRIPVMDYADIEPLIHTIRSHRVMLDHDLATLYGVRTKALNQQVRRNRDRFPDDFMFRLSKEESLGMRSQIVTASRRNSRHQPYAFTEHGVAMLSSVLNSAKAIQANIAIMRAFINMRRCLAASPDLAERMRNLESRLDGQQAVLGEHTQAIKEVFADIRKLMYPPLKRRRRPSATWLRVVTTVRRPPRAL